MGTKTSTQCKSHHQKKIKFYGGFEEILAKELQQLPYEMAKIF